VATFTPGSTLPRASTEAPGAPAGVFLPPLT
jgi:hypothetical protein